MTNHQAIRQFLKKTIDEQYSNSHDSALKRLMNKLMGRWEHSLICEPGRIVVVKYDPAQMRKAVAIARDQQTSSHNHCYLVNANSLGSQSENAEYHLAVVIKKLDDGAIIGKLRCLSDSNRDINGQICSVTPVCDYEFLLEQLADAGIGELGLSVEDRLSD